MTPVAPARPGRRLALARAAWLAFGAVGLAVLGLSVPLHWAQWAQPCAGALCRVGQLTSQQAQQLPQIALTLPAWASILSVLWHAQPLAALAIAALIFARRGDDPMALFTSFVLVASSIGGIADFASAAPAVQLLENVYALAGAAAVRG